MTPVVIGPLQLVTIFANLVFGKAIGYSSEVMARSVGNDAWLAMLMAFVSGVPIMVVAVWLARRFGTERPASYIPRLAGAWVGKPLLLALLLFFFFAFHTSSITVEQHLNDYLMVETPLIIFVVGYVLVCWYGVHLGLEGIARLSVLGLGLTLLLDLLMVVGSVDHFDYTRLLPILDHGLVPVAMASTAADIDVAMATTAALLLFPLTRTPERWMRLGLWGLGVGMLITAVWTVFEIGVLGPHVTAQYLIACMQMARAAELSIWLPRYEMVMVVLFVYSVYTQSMICLYCATELARAFLPKVNRAWVIAGCSLLSIPVQYALAFDRDWYGHFLATWWPALSVPVAFGAPLLLALLALLRPAASKAPQSPPAAS